MESNSFVPGDIVAPTKSLAENNIIGVREEHLFIVLATSNSVNLDLAPCDIRGVPLSAKVVYTLYPYLLKENRYFLRLAPRDMRHVSLLERASILVREVRDTKLVEESREIV